MSLAGELVRGVAHKDYTRDVPSYLYCCPNCSKTIQYQIPLGYQPLDYTKESGVDPREVKDEETYGWCPYCKEPFLYNRFTINCVPPSNAHGKYSDRQISKRLDEALLRNRVADALWTLSQDHLSREEIRSLADYAGVSHATVSRVADDLGFTDNHTYSEKDAA